MERLVIRFESCFDKCVSLALLHCAALFASHFGMFVLGSV